MIIVKRYVYRYINKKIIGARKLLAEMDGAGVHATLVCLDTALRAHIKAKDAQGVIQQIAPRYKQASLETSHEVFVKSYFIYFWNPWIFVFCFPSPFLKNI